MNELLPIVMEVGEINLKCMEMLDKANTESFGKPAPTEVGLTMKKFRSLLYRDMTFTTSSSYLNKQRIRASASILTESC